MLKVISMQSNIYYSSYPFNFLFNEKLDVEVSSYMNFVKISFEIEDKEITYCIDTNNHKLIYFNENNIEGDK